MHAHRLVHHPGEDHRPDDHHVAADHQDDQPVREHPLQSQGDIDADQQQLVGQGIEIGTELGHAVIILGNEAVDGIGDPGGDEDGEGKAKIAGNDQPNEQRHHEDAGNRQQIGHAHRKNIVLWPDQ
jgi:hypothetical protein